MQPQFESVMVAIGLAVLGLLGLVVVWKITKSLVKLLLWSAVLLALGAGTLWLLGEAKIISRPATWFAPAPVK
jgi:hypothetical protein